MSYYRPNNYNNNHHPSNYNGNYYGQPQRVQQIYNNHQHSNYNGYYGQPQHQRMQQNLFPEFDRNRDGVITEQDFALAARQKNLGYDGEMIYRNAFRQVDKNRDGYLNQHETGNNYSVIRDIMY